MKFCYLCSIIFLSYSGFCEQNHSPTVATDTTLTDTTAVNAFLELSKNQKWRDSYRSLQYADRALALAEKIDYKKGVALAQNLRGFCFWSFGDNDLAIQAGIEALHIGRDEEYPLIQAESYYTLARGYMDVSDRAKSRETIEIAKDLASDGKDWELLTSVYNLLGVVLYVEDKKDSALYYYTKALDLGKEHHVDPVNFARIISNIGECYSSENPKLGFTYFTKAISLARETGNSIAEASIGDVIGHALLRDNKLEEAELTLQAALEQARGLGLRRVIRHAYSGLVDIKLKQGKGNEAVMYLRKSYAVRDSLMNTSKIRQIVELESKYELQLKDQNIKLLESQKRVQALWTNLLIASMVFLILIGIGLYYLQTYRHRKNREVLNLEIDFLTQQHKETEDRFRSALVPHEEVESNDQKLLKKAISVVEANISDKLFSVEKMADEMNMSRTSLHRKIKSITGFAPGELIRSIRLRKAAKLIASRADSVTQIAQLVGFDDYSYFSKSFKKHFGVSPTQYGPQLTDKLRTE
ncbi:MAG TPA: helix-turn-helix domain-containing protein [Chryseolinea sp.]|nr:helix-turn-helix domain-containing protein [Chryseolinea sp.]